MSCDSAQEAILKLFDEPLQAQEQEALMAHVAECQICSDFMQQQSALDHMFAEAFVVQQPGSAFTVRLLQVAQREREDAWPEYLVQRALLGGGIAGAVVLTCLSSLPMLVAIGLAVGFGGAAYAIECIARDLLEHP